MKKKFTRRLSGCRVEGKSNSQRGSVLLIASLCVVVLTLAVGTYLEAVRSDYRATTEQLAWNQALDLAEAGVDIAISHAQAQDWAGWTQDNGNDRITPSPNPLTLRHSNNKVIGTVAISCQGFINNVANPVIQATGAVTVQPGGNVVRRTVRLILRKGSGGSGVLNAKHDITFNGDNVMLDSYNSQLGSYASQVPPGGTHAKANATVNTLASDSHAFMDGNSDVWGNANTAPGGVVTIGPNGFVSGTITHILDGSLADVTVPAGFPAAQSLSSFEVGGNYVLTGSNNPNAPTYIHLSSLSLSGNNTLTISGYVRVLIDGSYSISGNGGTILSTNSAAEVYVGGSASISGNGIVNNTGNPHNLSLFGLNTSTSFSVSGNGQWSGIIYAPHAALAFSGNEIGYGSLGADTITFSGNTQLHYDETLQIPGVVFGMPFIVNAWKEFLPAVAAVPPIVSGPPY